MTSRERIRAVVDRHVATVGTADTDALAEELGDRLAGKIVVDISNPLTQTFDALATAPGTSAAEELAGRAPSGARVVKAFNTTFAPTLVEGQVAGQPLDVFGYPGRILGEEI